MSEDDPIPPATKPPSHQTNICSPPPATMHAPAPVAAIPAAKLTPGDIRAAAHGIDPQTRRATLNTMQDARGKWLPANTAATRELGGRGGRPPEARREAYREALHRALPPERVQAIAYDVARLAEGRTSKRLRRCQAWAMKDVLDRTAGLPDRPSDVVGAAAVALRIELVLPEGADRDVMAARFGSVVAVQPPADQGGGPP